MDQITLSELPASLLALTGFVIGSAKVFAILALWSRSLDWHQTRGIKHSEAASDETRRLAFLRDSVGSQVLNLDRF